MPPTTRRQFSMQAADTQLQSPGLELSKDETPTPSLLRLPAELQKTVVEYLTCRPSDMRHVCEASKELHALMLPYLYRNVRLYVGALHKETPPVFTVGNPGLVHIRTLCFIDGQFVQAFDNEKHLPSLLQLLSLLPKNMLRVFELRTRNSVHQDLGLLLRIRQQALKNYQYHSVPSAARPLTPTFDEIRHVSCLQMVLKNGRDCDIAGELFSHMPLVTTVAITLSNGWLDHTMGDQGETGRKVINKVFSSANTIQNRLKVRILRIEGMSLKSAGVTLPTVLPLEGLEQLHLFSCRYTSRLCASLAGLKLHLKVLCDQRAYNEPSPGTVDAFLTSLRWLRVLRLSRDWRSTSDFEPCDWPSLLPCAHELRSLDLDEHDPGPDGILFLDTRRSLPGFKTFCDRASQLQQLSMRSPGLEKIHWDATHGLKAVLGCLRKLRDLRLLKLSCYPDCLARISDPEDEEEMDEWGETFCEVKLDRACKTAAEDAKAAADYIFESLTRSCPRFVALAIDINDPAGGPLDNLEFMRATQTDLLGKSTYVAQPIEWGTIKYYEPCSDILKDTQEDGLLEL